MSKQMELAFKIASKMDGSVAGNFKKISNEMKDLQNNMKKLKEYEKALANDRKAQENFAKQAKSLNSLNKEMLEASKKLSAMKKAYEQSGKSNSDLSNAIKKQEKVVETLNKKVERQKGLFKAARSEIEHSKKVVDDYAKSLGNAKTEIEAFNKKQEEIKRLNSLSSNLATKGDSLQSKGKKNMAQGAGMIAAMSVPIKAYIDVEEAQADLKKMINFTSKAEAESFYSAFRNISDKSPISQVDVFKMAGAGAQAGIAKNELKQFTEDASKIKVAFDMNSEAAGEFLAKTRSQLGLNQQQVMAYADTINFLADNTAAQATDIVEVSQRVASLGDMAGVSKEQVAAFGATLVSIGKTPEIASTGLKNLYSDLMSGEAATESQMIAFKNLGLEATQVAKSMTKDGAGTIINVLERIKKLPKDMQASTIKQIFGQEALDSVVGLVNNLDSLKGNLSAVNDQSKMAGSVNKEYSNRMSTTLTSLKQGFNQLYNIFVDLGKALAPSLVEVAKSMQPIVKNLADFIQKNPKLTTGILKAVVALGALKIAVGAGQFAFGGLFKTAGKAVGLFSKVKSAGGVTKAFPMVAKAGPMLARMGPMLMNPWVLAGAVIVGIFVLLYKKSTWFRNGVNKAMKEIMPYIKEIGKLLKDAIGKSINYVGNLMKKHGPAMRKAFDAMKPVLSVLGNIIKTLIISGLKTVIATIKLFLSIAKGVFQNISNSIKTAVGVWKGLFKLVIAVFTGDWKAIPGIVSGIWDTIKSGVKGFIDSFKTMFSGVFTWFGDQWKNVKSTASSIFSMGKIPGKFSGTRNWSGGMVEVAEKGRELIQLPNGQSFMATQRMYMNLPKGTKITNNTATENLLKQPKQSLLDKVDNIKNKASKVINNAVNSMTGGDNITVNINVSGGGDPNEIERAVRMAFKKIQDKNKRTEF